MITSTGTMVERRLRREIERLDEGDRLDDVEYTERKARRAERRQEIYDLLGRIEKDPAEGIQIDRAIQLLAGCPDY